PLELRCAVRHPQPLTVVTEPPALARVRLFAAGLEGVAVPTEELPCTVGELQQLVVDQGEALGEVRRWDVTLPHPLARLGGDRPQRGAADEPGALVEEPVVQQQALGEGARVVGQLADDLYRQLLGVARTAGGERQEERGEYRRPAP